MTDADKLLAARREVGAKVEKDMLDFLIGFEPAEKLTVSTIKDIARFARLFAFNALEQAADMANAALALAKGLEK